MAVASAGSDALLFRQITMPAPQHLTFAGWMLFLMPSQHCQSEQMFCMLQMLSSIRVFSLKNRLIIDACLQHMIQNYTRVFEYFCWLFADTVLLLYENSFSFVTFKAAYKFITSLPVNQLMVRALFLLEI